MHPSIHSDCFAPLNGRQRHSSTARRGHFDSLLRGMAVLGVATLLGGATLIADMAQRPGADAAPRLASFSSGAAVNLMHREVVGH